MFAVKHVENLKDWKNGKRKSMPFAIPMVSREGKDHIKDCHFCMINLKGINHKNKHHVQYLNIPSAIRPIPHGPNLPVPEPDGNIKYSSDSENSDMTVAPRADAYKTEEDDQPVSLTHAELNNLTQDLNLSKEPVQLLGSHLLEKHLLAPGTTFSWYQDHEKELRQFFMFQCRIQEKNWRATVEFPPTRGTNISQTALSVITLGLFSKELWIFEWRAVWILSPRPLWKSATKADEM